MLKLSSVYGKSSNLEVRGVLDERCPKTSGCVHVDDLDVDYSEPETCSGTRAIRLLTHSTPTRVECTSTRMISTLAQKTQVRE